MSQNVNIDPDAGLITVRLSGRASAGDIRELALQMVDHEHYQPELPQLIDCRGLDLVRDDEQLTGPGLSGFALFALRFYRQAAPTSVAVVVDPDMSRAQMADVYRICCAIGVAELFEDYELALKWLMRREFASASPVPLKQTG